MNKPIGYYIDTEIPVIKELEQKCGSMLQRLSEREKIYLAYRVTCSLERLNNTDCYEGLTFYFVEKIERELTDKSNAIALLKALVNSL